MKALFEPNIDGMDYLELILSLAEYNSILEEGAAQEFKKSLVGNRELNVFIRIENNKD
jgi:hypothetical protein